MIKGNNKNQLKIGIILSYVSMALNMVIQLAYTPIMIRLLGQSEYGLYNLVGSVVSYLNLFSFGFSGAYLRFFNRAKKVGENEVAKLNGTFLVSFSVMATLAFVCGITLAQFTNQIFGTKLTIEELHKAKILMIILVVNLAISLLSSLFDSIISAHEKFLFQRIVSILGMVFSPLICLPLLLSGYGSVEMVLTSTGITIAKFGSSIYYCLKNLKISFKLGKIEKALIKEISAFSGFIFLNMIIDQINWNVDKYILGRTSGTEGVAVYGVGAQINSLVMSFSTAISSVFSPRVHYIANNNSENETREKFSELFIKVGRIQFMVLGLIITGLIFFGKYFITNIYAGKEYGESYYVGLLLIIPAIVPYIQNLGIEIQRSVNKHQVRALVYSIMALFNVAISVPLAIAFGPIGSALGTSLSLICGNVVFMNIYYKKVIGLDILKFWKNILEIFIPMIPAIALGIVLQILDIFMSIGIYLVFICVYLLIYCLFVYLFGMNQEERNIIKNMLNKICKKSR